MKKEKPLSISFDEQKKKIEEKIRVHRQLMIENKGINYELYSLNKRKYIEYLTLMEQVVNDMKDAFNF